MGLRLNLVPSHLEVYRHILDSNIPCFQRHNTETMGYLLSPYLQGLRKSIHVHKEKNSAPHDHMHGHNWVKVTRLCHGTHKTSKCKLSQNQSKTFSVIQNYKLSANFHAKTSVVTRLLAQPSMEASCWGRAEIGGRETSRTNE